MRKFSKSHKLDHVCYDIRGPVLEKASEMESAGTKILKLNIGNPAPFNFSAPDEIIHDMIYTLRDAEGYSDSKGIFSARKSIMQYSQLKNLPNVEILVPAPDYPLWTAAVTLAGGNAVHYICDEQNEWNPDIDDIKKKITDRTKGIVIINPNNPTGALYSEEILKEIVEVARSHQLIIFSEEIYDRLVMDSLQHISIASLAPDIPCITFNGLSKSHRIAGFRCGWMCISGNKAPIKDYIEGLNLLSSMRLCSNVPAQEIIQTALGGYQSIDELLLPGGRIYEQREAVWKALNSIDGVSAMKPKAAFYIFPKIDSKKYNIKNDEQMVYDFLVSKKILLVQGSAFNYPTPDHVRIVYLPTVKQLNKACKEFEDFLKHYKQK